MSRTIKVNTDELRDAALRFERLAYSIEDITGALNGINAELSAAAPILDYQRRASTLCREADGLVYRVHAMCGKLHFAAACYEEYVRRMKRPARDDARNAAE